VDESERLLSVTPFDDIRPRPDDIQLDELPDLEDPAKSVVDYLSGKALSKDLELYDFILSNLNLKGIREDESLILDTKTLFNLQTQDDKSLSLFVNLQRINDISTINKYFAVMNTCMKEGGYVVGCGNVIRHIREKYSNNYNKLIGSLLYSGNFIFKRVLAKLPVSREIHYFFTKGKNRTLSQTEILGRLVYNGFKIIDTKDINDKLYFIAAKVNIPYEKGNPSYGPFISLKRVGKGGKELKIYKFRTMHPYSEYLQEYVYEKNDLAKGGKLKDDFRITNWGKVFRKLWIDELPQFINLFRGDIKVVGVRALSPHYLSLYPKDFQEYRKNFKPGILPPFYVDLPETMDEIVASEKKYLESYSKYKIFADIKYFGLIFFNIVFKGKRSA
jgi:lipopolysaccharide/colanic/teichoic acid biosynthesis glycosyltransferase